MLALQDICTINPKSSLLQDSFIYIDLEAVEKGELKNVQSILREEAPSRAQRVIEYNDILFQCVRPYQKNNYIHRIQNKDEQQWVASTGYAQIRTTESPNYIYHILNTESFNRKVIVRCTGSSYPAINSTDLASIRFYFAIDKKEQNKIATFLSLLDERIATQNKIIEELKKLKVCVRTLIFRTLNCSWFLLSELEANGDICLKRGNIIPKHEHTDIFCYPVYSSSVQNGGLMGYNNTYMFNNELVTWSIDGGGNFFYRHKHKFNVTNVSGYMQLNEAKYNYRFVSEILLWQHSFMVFDYQTKAHPSVIKSIYKLPDMSLAEQELIANIFRLLDIKLQNEITILKQYQQQKQYLLRQMFI